MRKAYKEGGELPTLWIIDEGLRIAIECDAHRDYDTPPMPNERCITHDMCYWHGSSICEIIRDSVRCPIPIWFWDVVHEYDGLCKV